MVAVFILFLASKDDTGAIITFLFIAAVVGVLIFGNVTKHTTTATITVERVVIESRRYETRVYVSYTLDSGPILVAEMQLDSYMSCPGIQEGESLVVDITTRNNGRTFITCSSN